VLTPADVQRAASQGFASLRLRFIAAHGCVPTSHRIEHVWRARERADAIQAPDAGPARIFLVWRQPDTSVHHRPLDPDELTLLPRLREGLSFIEPCTTLSTSQPAELAAQLALTLLSELARLGLARFQDVVN
jgi:hypothetical protein